MDEALSRKLVSLLKVTLLTPCEPMEKGSVPSDAGHWYAESMEIRFSSNSSESGHIKSKSVSADIEAFCTSHWPFSGLRSAAESFPMLSCPGELGLGMLCLDTWLAGGEGNCAYSWRVCNFSWRERESCRAKGRLHSLHTYGRAPVSLSVS